WNVRYGRDLSPANNAFFRTYVQADDESEAIIFNSETCLRHVRGSGNMTAHMDASFEEVPRTANIYRLFTIHMVYMDMAIDEEQATIGDDVVARVPEPNMAGVNVPVETDAGKEMFYHRKVHVLRVYPTAGHMSF
ncbi:hypothetical protein CBL_20193, partial [Carabus blaptoides fortunei]